MTKEEKIDIHNQKLSAYIYSLEHSEISNRNKDIIKRFINDAKLGKNSILRARRKRECGERRLCKIIYSMKNIALNFNKDLDKVNQKDIESYIAKLNKKDYTDNTKADYKKLLIKFLRWQFHEGEKFHQFTDLIGA